MRWLIVSDIFGHTPALESWCTRLPGEAQIVQPYSTPPPGFADDHAAYAHFTVHSDIERFAARVLDGVKRFQPQRVVGFSAGGAAAWLAACSDSFSARQLLCFYPGQVRHYLDKQPQIPCELIFAAHEAHFDVQAVMAKLSHLAGVKVRDCAYAHGFMNPLSAGFDACAETYFTDYLCN